MTARQPPRAPGPAPSRGLRWVVLVLVGALLTGACTGGPGVDPTVVAGSESRVSSASAPAFAGPDSSSLDSARLLPQADTPAERQIDQAVVAALQARFATAGYRQLRSVVVLAEGRTVFEGYYQGDQFDYHHVWSVTKSVVSTLIGIAIARGELEGVKQTLEQLLPDDAPGMSPEVAGTTLGQVLTMTAGLRTDDPGALPTATRDWVAAILTEPYSAPGQGFHYSNAGSHLLSAILVQATGRSTLDYAREVLFDPLGIPSVPAFEPTLTGEDWESFGEAFDSADFAWPVDPQGIHTGGWGLRLRAQDLAKIGLLYLGNGRWQDQQVVPEAWVREATRAQVDTVDGYTPSYGYQWWVTTADKDAAYAALGTGGQVLEVVPSRDLVVVFQFHGAGGGLGRMLPLVDTLIAPAYQP